MIKILIHLSLFILKIIIIETVKNSVLHFPGDQSLWYYLQRICSEDSLKFQKIKIILIENVYPTIDNRVKNRLNDFDCPFDLYVNESSDKLDSNVFQQGQKSEYRDRNLLIIFNLSYSIHEKEIQSYLQSLIKVLQIFYNECYSCEPYMLAFITANSNFNLTHCLYQSLSELIWKLDRNFRLIVIGGNDSKSMTTTIHLRPIFDGCRMTNSVYIPKTDEDFDKIKTPYLKCNLKQQPLKVVVNDVS